MNTIGIQVNIPSDVLSLLRLSKAEMEQEVQHWIALELFRRRQISAGKAAEIADLSLVEFMDLTRQYRVNWVDYTDEELAVELREAAVLGRTLREQTG
jgi:predicted HTH domain antitoxin